jgi:hypothetical protein
LAKQYYNVDPTTATAGVWLGTIGVELELIQHNYNKCIYKYKKGRWANVVTTANKVLGIEMLS